MNTRNAAVRGYLDSDGTWYLADAVVPHPYNKDNVTYGQLEPDKYRLIDRSEPFDDRSEYFVPVNRRWDRTFNSSADGYGKTRTYRIALDLSSLIAVGHNPHKLTDAQIETHLGWRLISVEEFEFQKKLQYPRVYARLTTEEQYWSLSYRWETNPNGCMIDETETVRTKQPPGYFLTDRRRAVGHNPHKLSSTQVEESQGWRLLTDEEMKAPQRKGHLKYIQRTKTVPKTLADLPKRPFWRKLGAAVRDQAAGTSTNNFNSHYIDVYIRRGDTYAETLDGPWLPFTKEVECE